MDGRTAEPGGFRWRGREVSRLEGLSDAVFGFAITLLVVSLEVPRTAGQLFDAMRGFTSFAACFAVLFLVWLHQYRFFRRYGLDDGPTILLNAVLLFVVVFFTYPLKFVFGIVVGMVSGERPWLETVDGVPVLSAAQWPVLMIVFSAGYMAVFLIFALLHVHAWRLRDALELDALERFDTVDNVRESLLNVGIGAASVLLALLGGVVGAALAGFIYWLVGPVVFANGVWAGRRRKQLADVTVRV